MEAHAPATSAGHSSEAGISPVAGHTPGLRAWAVLGTLCFVYVLNFLDRSLLSILAKPIQDSLHITDGQLGLIGGLFFRDLLLLHLDSGRLARRQDQQGLRS